MDWRRGKHAFERIAGKEQGIILEVCVHAAMANKVLEKEEQEMIFAYCREMNIPEHIPDMEDSFEGIAAKLASQTDDAEKRIIALEILGLVKADGRFDGKEKAFFDKLIEGLQIEQDIVSRLESLLERYSAVCKEIYASVYE